ncbi:Hypothetical protein, putative [Bodo saltans]|uniref:RING-type domain-containing protein n=1 Tax=Bodo saltans TaxID=75058 RepID=A0A0S4JER0_BODSA|nr:Hypothetical protein, putative [Bodo saltans]|eukprot:CUG88662.1 Hypothetical protein, putative [Bodo saltans]
MDAFQSLSSFFICKSCKKALRNVFTLSPCMHKMCGDCVAVTSLYETISTCPECDARVEAVGKDGMLSEAMKQMAATEWEKYVNAAVERFAPKFPTIPTSNIRALLMQQLDGEGGMDERSMQRRLEEVVPRPAPSTAAPPGSGLRRRVNIFWDLDEFLGWHNKDIERLYLALVSYCVNHDAQLRKNQVQCVAVGTNYAFQDPAVIKTLQDMQVKCELVSSHEQTKKYIKQLASTVVKQQVGQTTTEVVLISSDKDFQPDVRTLENESDIRVMVLHNAERGSQHEQLLSLSPTTLLHLSELIGAPPSVPPSGSRVDERVVASSATGDSRSSQQPVSTSRPAAPVARPPRSTGRVSRWAPDKSGKYFGFIDEGTQTVFLHSALVLLGTPTVGCRVSFRAEPNPKNPAQRQAYDAVVLADGEEVGSVARWDQKDKNGMAFGFVETAGASHYLATSDLAGIAPSVGDEMVFRVADSIVRPRTTQAKNARILSPRGASAQSATEPPPPPPPFVPNAVPIPSAFNSSSVPTSLRAAREVGILRRWAPDKSGKCCGHIESNNQPVFLHSAVVLHGTPAVGCRVSFRSEPSPKNPSQRQAYDAVVLADGEDVGTVKGWGPDKSGIPCGSVVTANGANHTLKSGDFVRTEPSDGDEMVFSVFNNGGKTAAKNACVLCLRGSGAPSAATVPHPPPFVATAVPTSRRAVREVGKVTRWALDKNGKYCGFIESSPQAVFLHSASVVHGTPAVGCRVSFRSEPSPSNPAQRQAYDAVVLADGEEVGGVVRWDQKDKNGMAFGFVETAATNHYLATSDLAGSAPRAGDEMVFHVVNSIVRPGTTQAKNAIVLRLRGAPQ